MPPGDPLPPRISPSFRMPSNNFFDRSEKQKSTENPVFSEYSKQTRPISIIEWSYKALKFENSPKISFEDASRRQTVRLKGRSSHKWKLIELLMFAKRGFSAMCQCEGFSSSRWRFCYYFDGDKSQPFNTIIRLDCEREWQRRRKTFEICKQTRQSLAEVFHVLSGMKPFIAYNRNKD